MVLPWLLFFQNVIKLVVQSSLLGEPIDFFATPQQRWEKNVGPDSGPFFSYKHFHLFAAGKATACAQLFSVSLLLWKHCFSSVLLLFSSTLHTMRVLQMIIDLCIKFCSYTCDNEIVANSSFKTFILRQKMYTYILFIFISKCLHIYQLMEMVRRTQILFWGQGFC